VGTGTWLKGCVILANLGCMVMTTGQYAWSSLAYLFKGAAVGCIAVCSWLQATGFCRALSLHRTPCLVAYSKPAVLVCPSIHHPPLSLSVCDPRLRVGRCGPLAGRGWACQHRRAV
jgi:hypothetical protein